MRTLLTEIEIDAPVEKIWDILMDFEHWKDWSPIIKAGSGNAALGSELSITMNGKDGKNGPKYAPVVTIFEAPKDFRWRAKMMAEFIFTNDKVFELEATSSGTRLIHKEEFSGLMVSLFWGKLNDGVVPMLNAMNKALKEHVEK